MVRDSPGDSQGAPAGPGRVHGPPAIADGLLDWGICHQASQTPHSTPTCGSTVDICMPSLLRGAVFRPRAENLPARVIAISHPGLCLRSALVPLSRELFRNRARRLHLRKLNVTMSDDCNLTVISGVDCSVQALIMSLGKIADGFPTQSPTLVYFAVIRLKRRPRRYLEAIVCFKTRIALISSYISRM